MNLVPAQATIVQAPELPKDEAAREQLRADRLTRMLEVAENVGGCCADVDANGMAAFSQAYGTRHHIHICQFPAAEPSKWISLDNFIVTSPVSHLQLAADSSRLLVQLEDRIQVWKLCNESGADRPRPIVSIKNSDLGELSTNVVIHPSGEYLFLATRNNELRVYEINQTNPRIDLRNEFKLLGEAKGIIFSPSGDKMALVLAEILEGRHLRYCVTVVGTHPEENGHIPAEDYKQKIGVYSPGSTQQVVFHGRHDAPYVHDNISINVSALDAHMIENVSFDPSETTVAIKVRNVSGETVLGLTRHQAA